MAKSKKKPAKKKQRAADAIETQEPPIETQEPDVKERTPQHVQYSPEDRPEWVRKGFTGPIPCPLCAVKFIGGDIPCVELRTREYNDSAYHYGCKSCDETFSLEVR